MPLALRVLMALLMSAASMPQGFRLLFSAKQALAPAWTSVLSSAPPANVAAAISLIRWNQSAPVHLTISALPGWSPARLAVV
jgi:hypothetical protein